jgi:hypothetical protein
VVNTRHEIAEGQWLAFGAGLNLRDWLNFHNATYSASL